jgi:hypothetical protein
MRTFPPASITPVDGKAPFLSEALIYPDKERSSGFYPGSIDVWDFRRVLLGICSRLGAAG